MLFFYPGERLEPPIPVAPDRVEEKESYASESGPSIKQDEVDEPEALLADEVPLELPVALDRGLSTAALLQAGLLSQPVGDLDVSEGHHHGERPDPLDRTLSRQECD
jgi:hypothetical protein